LKAGSKLIFPILVSSVVGLSFVVTDAPGFKMFSVKKVEARLFDQMGVEIPVRQFTYKALYGFNERNALRFADWLCSKKKEHRLFRIEAESFQVIYTPANCELMR
jgi:hypothetical protein